MTIFRRDALQAPRRFPVGDPFADALTDAAVKCQIRAPEIQENMRGQSPSIETAAIQLWLVRHAVVDGPSGTIWPADAPADLSDRRRFDSVRAHLPQPAKAYVSPLRRAGDTATALRLDGVAMAEFSEQDFGAWVGRRHDDLAAAGDAAYARFWQDPARSRPPGGESFADQIVRVGRGLARIDSGPAILIVHSGTIRAALAIALDIAPEAALRFVIDPLSLTRIDRLHDGWRVASVNQTFR